MDEDELDDEELDELLDVELLDEELPDDELVLDEEEELLGDPATPPHAVSTAARAVVAITLKTRFCKKEQLIRSSMGIMKTKREGEKA